MKACINCEGSNDDCFDPTKNPALRREIKAARKAMIPDNYIERVVSFARQGYKEMEFKSYDTDWDSEAYLTVSGQNSNNSVRVTDEFLTAVLQDRDWNLTYRGTGKVARTVQARDLWEKISYSAWACADPGIQFHSTINDWHTCPAGGDIRASNPCSEYMFLDDTACNLASLNLMQFRKDVDGGAKIFDVAAFEHGCRLWDHRARNLGADGAIPVQGDRAALLRLPHAGPGLRQYRRPAHGGGHPLRFARRPRHRRRGFRR